MGGELWVGRAGVGGLVILQITVENRGKGELEMGKRKVESCLLWKRKVAVVLLFFVLTVTGCGSPRYDVDSGQASDREQVSAISRLRTAEKVLGTQWDATWVYHRIVEEPQSLPLAFEGYIVAVEKGPKERVSHYAYEQDGKGKLGEAFYNNYLRNMCELVRREYAVDYEQADCSDFMERDEVLARGWDENALYRNLLDGMGWSRAKQNEKRHFVSHIFSYGLEKWPEGASSPMLMKTTSLYNVYDTIAGKESTTLAAGYPDAFQDGMEALNTTFAGDLENRLQNAADAGRPYTHIFFCSMGWHADQLESIRNFNSFFSQLVEQAALHKGTFRPLFIGLTWPSSWLQSSVSEMISYWNKAADADEIGTTIGADLLDQVILPQKKNSSLKVVVIGHSFGVRLSSSALFLRELAVPAGKTVSDETVDLYIGLEGAMSSNRFLQDYGMEGQPYKLDGKWAEKLVYTWSEYDTANPLTYYVPFLSGAPHIGGTPGFNNLTEYFETNENLPSIHFSKVFLPVAESDPLLLRPIEVPNSFSEPDARMICLNVSKLVQDPTVNKGGNAHSDIYDVDMARLLYQLVREYAWPDVPAVAQGIAEN